MSQIKITYSTQIEFDEGADLSEKDLHNIRLVSKTQDNKPTIESYPEPERRLLPYRRELSLLPPSFPVVKKDNNSFTPENLRPPSTPVPSLNTFHPPNLEPEIKPTENSRPFTVIPIEEEEDYSFEFPPIDNKEKNQKFLVGLFHKIISIRVDHKTSIKILWASVLLGLGISCIFLLKSPPIDSTGKVEITTETDSKDLSTPTPKPDKDVKENSNKTTSYPEFPLEVKPKPALSN